MPKIFGTSVLAIFLGSLAFYMVGFLIYGVLFSEQWLALVEMTEAEALARNEELGAMMFVWGYGVTLVQVLGLAWVMNQAGEFGAVSAIKVAAVIATFVSLPVLGYNWLYEGRAAGAVAMDYVHVLIGYSLACIIIGLFRGRN